MVPADGAEARLPLRTAVRYDELWGRDAVGDVQAGFTGQGPAAATARAIDAAQPERRATRTRSPRPGEALEMFAFDEVSARKAVYGRQLAACVP
ncbi:hypothetical protein [Actinomadura miaoliensis]|uniref:Uncharacterized protein n=1 Tax=Actinomadura miaoliensis TaxID=430685 RepID=A0ABP7UXU5_9ACTN